MSIGGEPRILGEFILQPLVPLSPGYLWDIKHVVTILDGIPWSTIPSSPAMLLFFIHQFPMIWPYQNCQFIWKNTVHIYTYLIRVSDHGGRFSTPTELF